ncbi:MAG TPA: hypothetical protein VMN81_06230 [Vicinamibacterales bacterium]|nr:hypothetical protein [Vicinamibacterales bacterium]
MADRNRSDLDREQRGSSNPNQTERPEDRSTSAQETGMGNPGNPDRDRGVGSETPGDRQDNTDPNRESGKPSGGNIEGDENLNRR